MNRLSPVPPWENEPPSRAGATVNARIVLPADNLQAMLGRASRLSPLSLQAVNELVDSMLRAEGKIP